MTWYCEECGYSNGSLDSFCCNCQVKRASAYPLSHEHPAFDVDEDTAFALDEYKNHSLGSQFVDKNLLEGQQLHSNSEMPINAYDI